MPELVGIRRTVSAPGPRIAQRRAMATMRKQSKERMEKIAGKARTAKAKAGSRMKTAGKRMSARMKNAERKMEEAGQRVKAKARKRR